MLHIKGARYNHTYIQEKEGRKKGLAQGKGDFCLYYILQYIEKVVPFNSVRMRTVKKGIRVFGF